MLFYCFDHVCAVLRERKKIIDTYETKDAAVWNEPTAKPAKTQPQFERPQQGRICWTCKQPIHSGTKHQHEPSFGGNG